MSSGKAAVFFGPGKPFEIREVPVPDVEPDAVLIRVSLANVCGSDLHFWRGDAPLRLPEDGWIFGHEMTGRVAKLGARVKTDSRTSTARSPSTTTCVRAARSSSSRTRCPTSWCHRSTAPSAR